MANRTAKRPRRFSTRLHRWTGIWSFAIVLVIAVTGILLNHTEALRLHERKVTSGWILRHYGVEPKGDPVVFRSGENRMAVWDGKLLFNGTLIGSAPDGVNPVGAGKVNDTDLAFAFPNLVVVCDASGGLLDRLDEASLPPGKILRAASLGGVLVVEMDSGAKFRLQDWVEVIPHEEPDPEWWTSATDLSPEERETFASAFRGEGLPSSRIVLDLHSGRFFGVAGVIIYDVAAAMLIILGITGVHLWFRRRRQGQSPPNSGP